MLYSQENTSVDEFVFNNVADIQACNKRLQHRFFPVNIVQFLRTPILKNNWVQLLLIMAIWLLYVFQGNSTIILSMVSLLFWVKARTVYLIEQFRSSQGVMSVIWLSLLNALFMVGSILCRHASISHPYICETSCLRCPTLNSDMHVHALCILLAPLQIPYSV